MPNKDLTRTTEEDFDKMFTTAIPSARVLHITDGSRVLFSAASIVTPNHSLNHGQGHHRADDPCPANDISKHGTTDNAISPGPTGTDLFYNSNPGAVVKTMAEFNSMNKIKTPEEIAEVIGLGSILESTVVSHMATRNVWVWSYSLLRFICDIKGTYLRE